MSFIGDSLAAANVEGARRSPCKVESCTTAAGFVLEAVKLRRACYKRVVAWWERDEGRCQWCGAEDAPENPIQYDHIHPWSLGGENTVENLELLSRKHNLEKGDQVYVRGLEHFAERARRRRRADV
jgi:5-methylcytosine-specific restriction endonuclease McrA